MDTRQHVYNIINGERDYQDKRWGGESHDKYKSVGDFLIYIDDYVRRAKEIYTSDTDVDATLHVVRKIAALAVACMEYNGAPPR